jgi:hypothetical protein
MNTVNERMNSIPKWLRAAEAAGQMHVGPPLFLFFSFSGWPEGVRLFVCIMKLYIVEKLNHKLFFFLIFIY